MADTVTTNYELVKPEVNASANTWGDKTNANWDKLDALLKTFSTATSTAQAKADSADTKATNAGTAAAAANTKATNAQTAATNAANNSVPRNGSAPMTAALEIKATNPQLRLHFPGNRIWYTQVIDGRFRIVDESGGVENASFRTDGQFWSRSNVNAGGAFLETNGNVQGDLWLQYGTGNRDAYSAIAGKIEQRASDYRATVGPGWNQLSGYSTSGNQNETNFPLGQVISVQGGDVPRRSQQDIRLSGAAHNYQIGGSNDQLTGAWRSCGGNNKVFTYQRVA